jgi:hypothetical protein
MLTVEGKTPLRAQSHNCQASAALDRPLGDAFGVAGLQLTLREEGDLHPSRNAAPFRSPEVVQRRDASISKLIERASGIGQIDEVDVVLRAPSTPTPESRNAV